MYFTRDVPAGMYYVLLIYIEFSRYHGSIEWRDLSAKVRDHFIMGG